MGSLSRFAIALALPLALAGAVGPAAAQQSSMGTPDPVGDWVGELDVGAARLTLVFHVTRGDDGTLSSTMDTLRAE